MGEAKNKFKDCGAYYIGYTPRRNNEFLIDWEDYFLIKDYKWIYNSTGVVTRDMGKEVDMIKLLFNNNGVYYHKNGNMRDYRRDNLVNARDRRNVISYNGYNAVYMPEHHRAFDNGCVYMHILIAELSLSRELLPEEVVHHKDFNRKNNLESNLMVFATESDHIAYHNGEEAELQENGSYICKNKSIVEYRYINVNKNQNYIQSDKIIIRKNWKKLCPKCKTNYMDVSSNQCIECRKIEVSKNIPDKEILEKRIFFEPFEAIGRDYNVTGNAVKRWCKKYNLPSTKREIKELLQVR